MSMQERMNWIICKVRYFLDMQQHCTMLNYLEQANEFLCGNKLMKLIVKEQKI